MFTREFSQSVGRLPNKASSQKVTREKGRKEGLVPNSQKIPRLQDCQMDRLSRSTLGDTKLSTEAPTTENTVSLN
jgi:hypothetical protein